MDNEKTETCSVKGCENQAPIGKTYFKDVHMTGYNVNGLDVTAKIRLCKECDGNLHGNRHNGPCSDKCGHGVKP